MVVDENGSFVTQRQLPKMALITPLVSDGCLIITAEGMPELKVSIEPPTEKRNCRYLNKFDSIYSKRNKNILYFKDVGTLI